MKFYLIDDDQNIINILKLIIKNRNLWHKPQSRRCSGRSEIHPAGYHHRRSSDADHGRNQLCKKSRSPLP